MKQFIQNRLKSLSIKILKKYHPKIIAVTGSVGKTGTKEAIFAVLSKKFNVRASIGNYNNEIGVPLSIIGEKSPGKSIIGWIKVFLKAYGILFFNVDYPKFLILEIGADKPGDIKYLAEFIKPDIAVVTAIGPSHLEFFENEKHIAKEKFTLVKALDKNGLAILNDDDKYTKEFREGFKKEVLTFGFTSKADIFASDFFVNSKGANNAGITFKLNYRGSSIPIRLNNILNKSQVYCALVAALIGIHFNINLIEISGFLASYVVPPGRGRLIMGEKKTMIIDETYNSAPMSVIAALEILGDLEKKGRKIAVLGDMLELGEYSIKGHEEVGQAAAKVVDYLLTVGEKSKFTAQKAIKSGLSKENVFTFDNTGDAGNFLEDFMKKDDIILVKGSQGMRMERIVEEIMADPASAFSVLVRQGCSWKRKK